MARSSRSHARYVLLAGLVLGGAVPAASRADTPPAQAPAAPAEAPLAPARDRGLAWLAAHQAEDGSWGRTHTPAVTGIACAAFLASRDDPFTGEGAGPLVRGLRWLVGQAKDGVFPAHGHSWIHGQGYATLALAEAHGKVLLGATKPDLDLVALRETLAKAVRVIESNQSTSGGWWYTPGASWDHEGSTTVCAVQALVAARNYGIPTDEAVLDRGFEYLKRCQNPDGGFDYKEGPGTVSMKEGTAADVATLALMKRFDYDVMVKGVSFLEAIGPTTVSAERFPYYGHFYAWMGLTLYGEEMAAPEKAAAWIGGARETLLGWQQEDGSWPLRGWMLSSGGEDAGYATAFAALILSVPEARLSILRRVPPALPKAAGAAR